MKLAQLTYVYKKELGLNVMSKFFMPPQSFIKEERELLSGISRVNYDLIKEIGDRAEVWVIGRSQYDTSFWEDEIIETYNQCEIIDPLDDRPIKNLDSLIHFAVLEFRIAHDTELFYGNCGFELSDFVTEVLNKTIRKIILLETFEQRVS